MRDWFEHGFTTACMTLWTTVAHASASEEAKSITGIPIDVLFTLIGALVALVWSDMRRQQREQSKHLQKELDELKSQHRARGRTLASVQNAVMQICWQLKLKYDRNAGDEPSED